MKQLRRVAHQPRLKKNQRSGNRILLFDTFTFHVSPLLHRFITEESQSDGYLTVLYLKGKGFTKKLLHDQRMPKLWNKPKDKWSPVNAVGFTCRPLHSVPKTPYRYQKYRNLLFVTEFCERVFTAQAHARSLQTLKIQRTPLCLRARITLSAIIVIYCFNIDWWKLFV